tara:strand:+ start:2639 stop:3457 length:819 start_codon:yes stop_codon:yes gene_type:complete
MDLGTIIGLVSGTLLMAVASVLAAAGAGVSLVALWDLVSLLIVVGGAMAATAIAFPLDIVTGAMGGFAKVFKTQGFTFQDVVQDFVNLAEVARKGPAELGKAIDDTPEHMPFRLGTIKKGIGFIVDGYSIDDIREIHENMEEYRAIREGNVANAMKTMGVYAPAFGMIGTLIGLVFMLGSMALPPEPGVDPAAKLGGSMAVALITTLYGALFANFFFIPFADQLKFTSEQKKIESAIVLHGILLLAQKAHPMTVRDKLNAYLERKDRLTDEG